MIENKQQEPVSVEQKKLHGQNKITDLIIRVSPISIGVSTNESVFEIAREFGLSRQEAQQAIIEGIKNKRKTFEYEIDYIKKRLLFDTDTRNI